MAEPTLSDVHADLVGRFEHDKRLRLVEQGQARTEAILAELPRMEERLMNAIAGIGAEVRRVDDEATRPRPWPAIVSAAVAAVALVLVVAERLYS
jgi:hypothetical protein